MNTLLNANFCEILNLLNQAFFPFFIVSSTFNLVHCNKNSVFYLFFFHISGQDIEFLNICY